MGKELIVFKSLEEIFIVFYLISGWMTPPPPSMVIDKTVFDKLMSPSATKCNTTRNNNGSDSVWMSFGQLKMYKDEHTQVYITILF